jgi:hypothetical protein
MELTFGQKAAGVSFNPSKIPLVDDIKNKTAELIDLIHQARAEPTIDGEAKRYYSKAIFYIEDGQMNAVKAATWGL